MKEFSQVLILGALVGGFFIFAPMVRAEGNWTPNIQYYCDPQTTSVTEGGSFGGDFTDNCYYIWTGIANTGGKDGGLFRGTVGNATILSGHLLGAGSSGTRNDNDPWSMESPATNDPYFIAVWNNNANSADYQDYFINGGSPPDSDYGIISFVFGTGGPIGGGGGGGTTTIDACIGTDTHICDFIPHDGTTTPSGVSVDFGLRAYINPADLGSILGVRIFLHNIDQNVLLLDAFSPNDLILFDDNATSSGEFLFGTSTILADGNYRIKACLERTYFDGAIRNPFANLIEGAQDCQSHQFIVGSSTFIGNLSQNIFAENNEFFAGLSATSSAAMAHTCSPFGGDFDIRTCLLYLFIPDGNALNEVMENARIGIFSRMPWGYFTRVITILQNPTIGELPTFTVNIPTGAGSDTAELHSFEFDMADTVAGAGTLLDSIRDPIHNVSVRDVFYPFVQLTVALGVLLTILSDVAGSHRHASDGEGIAVTKRRLS